MAIYLTLIRHGNTAWNALGRYQGHAPTPLNERGQEQARCLADALLTHGPFHGLYGSDLLRCRQTAAPIAHALGLPVQFDPRFREMNYGNWQGLTGAELAELDPGAFAAYRADPLNVIVPGGESQYLLAERVLAGLADILARHEPGQHVMLVTHGGPIREILRRFSLWDSGLPSGNASRTVLALADDGQTATLVVRGDVSHLPPDLRPGTGGTGFLVSE